MQAIPENLFRNRNKVTDSEQFCARDEDVDLILEEICSVEPQSVSIVGERRIGKSSLLTHLYYLMAVKQVWKERIRFHTASGEAEPKYVSIFIDPEELVIAEPEQLTWVIIDELLRAEPTLALFAEQQPICPSRVLRGESVMPRPEIVLNRLLEWACRKENGYRFVFFIDEFELLVSNLQREEGDLIYLQYLRGISDNYHLAYVTASRIPLFEIPTESGASPFDNNFSRVHILGLLNGRDACIQLINRLLEPSKEEEHSFFFDDSDIDEVIEGAGWHPYYLKLACSCLFDFLVDKRFRGRSPKVPWEEAFQNAAAEEYRRLWTAFTPRERRLIVDMQRRRDSEEFDADGSPGVPYTIKAIDNNIDRLEKRGVLSAVEFCNKKYFKLFSESFRTFVSKRHTELLTKYRAVEDRISRCELRWNIKELTDAGDELRELELQLKEIGSESESTADKCGRLVEIIEAIKDFLEVMGRMNDPNITPEDSGKTMQVADNALHRLVDYFSPRYYVWFRQDPALQPAVAMALMEQLSDVLEYSNRPEKFANGYDEFLKVRYQFMKAFNWADKEPGKYRRLFHRSFSRLVISQDFARAEQMLRPDLRLPFALLKDFFIFCPVITIAFILGVPLAIGCFFQHNPLGGTLSKYPAVVPIISLVLCLVWNLLMAGQVAYSALFRQVEGLKNIPEGSDERTNGGTKYFRMLMFPSGMSGVLSAYGVAVMVCLTLVPVFSSAQHVVFSVCVPIVAVLVAVFIYAYVLRGKCRLPSYRIALKRSRYLCSMQFLHCFWLGILFSLCIVSPFFKSVRDSKCVARIGPPSCFIHIPLVLWCGTIGMIVILFALHQKMYSNRQSSLDSQAEQYLTGTISN